MSKALRAYRFEIWYVSWWVTMVSVLWEGRVWACSGGDRTSKGFSLVQALSLGERLYCCHTYQRRQQYHG